MNYSNFSEILNFLSLLVKTWIYLDYIACFAIFHVKKIKIIKSKVSD